MFWHEPFQINVGKLNKTQTNKQKTQTKKQTNNNNNNNKTEVLQIKNMELIISFPLLELHNLVHDNVIMSGMLAGLMEKT